MKPTPADQHRKTTILAEAVKLAVANGLNGFSRDEVAAAADCATGLVNFHFGTMRNLRRAIVGEAVRTSNLVIIAQALIATDPKTQNLARRAPEELRRAALEHAMMG